MALVNEIKYVFERFKCVIKDALEITTFYKNCVDDNEKGIEFTNVDS